MKNKNQGVELFIYDSNHKVLHIGFCKIFINNVTRYLTVKYKKGKGTLKASFDLQFLISSNILFVFASDPSKDFILSFINASTCRNVYDIVIADKTIVDVDNHEVLKERFIDQIAETNEARRAQTPRLKRLLADFVESLEGDEKQLYVNLLQQNNKDQDLGISNVVAAKLHEGLHDSNPLTANATHDENMADASKGKSVANRKRKQPSKITNIDGPVSLRKKRKPLPINEDEKIRKPNFEYHEKTGINGKLKKLLIIFNPNNKKQCYEYYWENKNQYFLCCGCTLMRKTCVARLHQDDKSGDFVTFGKAPHVCEWREYDISHFLKNQQKILPPNFEVREEIKNGVERKVLIILTDDDKTKCYKLYWTPTLKSYSCLECKKLRRNVNARVYDDPDGGSQYVVLGKNEHICSLQEYTVEEDNKIVESSGFEVVKSETGSKKVIVFQGENHQLCYEFLQYKPTSSSFFCLGCHERTNRNSGENAVIQLCKRKNGEEFIILKKWNHRCMVRKYQPQKFQEKVIKSSDDFVFYREKNEVFLAIFCTSNKEKFYKYNHRQYQSTGFRFICANCKNKRNVAKLCQDENGKEYLILGAMEHTCKAAPYSNIAKNKDIKVLDASGLPPQQPSRRGQRPNDASLMPPKVEKDQILYDGDFELQWSKNGKENGKLVVFCQENKKLCYELCHEDRNLYRCSKCKEKEKIQVTARLYYNDKKQPYLILGGNEHVCDLVEYVPDKGVLTSSDYLITEFDENKNPVKLVIFTDSKKKKCYTYTFWSQENAFRCRGCMRTATCVNAKFYKNPDGKDYLKLSPVNHVCEPEDYVPHEKEILPASRFVLMPSREGVFNGKLFVFKNNDKFNGYWFNFNKTVYYCYACRMKGTLVKAKLFEKNDGEKYLEVYFHQKHVCKSSNLVEEKRIIKAAKFEIITDPPGSKILHIKTYPGDEPSIFDFDDVMKAYCCRKCKAKKLFHTAIIYANENNEEFLIINGNFKC